MYFSNLYITVTDFPGPSCENKQIFCHSLYINIDDSNIKSKDGLLCGFEDITHSFNVDPFINGGFQ